MEHPARGWTAREPVNVERIPQETLLRVPQGGIPLDDLTGALKGTRFEGAALACSWVLAETGNFFLDHCYDDGFADPWEDDIVAEGTEEWRKAPFEPWGNDAGPVL